MGLFRPVKLAGCRLLGTSLLSCSCAKTCGHQVLNKVIFLEVFTNQLVQQIDIVLNCIYGIVI